MHIQDGLIPSSPLISQASFYLVIALIFVILSLIMTFSWANKESNKIKLIMLAVLVPIILALQALHITIPWGTSGSLVGATLAVIILGSPFPVILLMTLILLAQAIYFGYGGITTIGANIINMGVISGLVGFYSYNAMKNRFGMIVASFAAAWLSVFIAAEACALELSIAGTFPLKEGLRFMGLYHAGIGILEGIITAIVVIVIMLLTKDSTKDENKN